VGDDYLCRIHGGDNHIGAVALAQWLSGRLTTQYLIVSGHEERGIVVCAAHKLGMASRRNVSCIAGIHFDSLTSAQIEQIVQTAYMLIRKVAAQIEQHRFDEALLAPLCQLPHIASRTSELLHEVDEFLALDPDRVHDSVHAGIALTAAEIFGGRIKLFAPLYLSNACPNDCAYCGFRRSARIDRAHLLIEEAVQEAGLLATQGHRTIDLVTVCDATRAILEATSIRCINLNLGSLSTEQFRRLKAAGASGYHLYQETYNCQTYFEVHRSGLKRDMAYRLDGPRRAVLAGFKSIGLGILLGLHPFRYDLAALAGHARILIEEFPQVRIGFSLPRLQGVDSDCRYSVAAPVNDEEFLRAMLFLRLKFPAADLTLTTRERPEIRDRLIPLGVTKVSAGVTTAPGGYTRGNKAGAIQFHISDPRSLAEMVDVIHHHGRTTVYE
jgi:2-iminoacetate synthase